MSLDLIHVVMVFPGLCMFVKKPSVLITFHEPLASRLLSPLLRFQSASSVEVHLKLVLLLDVIEAHTTILHADLMKFQR